MSLARQGFFTHPIVVVFLIGFIGICFGASPYDKYRTDPPPPKECAPDMECAHKDVCINGTIDDGGINILNPRYDSFVNCDSDEVCCRISPEVPESADGTQSITVVTANGCGYRNPSGVTSRQRESFDETEFGEFPWMLAILENRESSAYLSGASLIHPRVALTAAHVIFNKPTHTLKVRAGEWTTIETTELLPYQDRPVSQKIIHESFNKDTLHFDIALLVLTEPFELKPHINTVCLQPATSRLDGVSCFTTGWGLTATKRQVPTYLKKIRLGVVEYRTCQDMLRKTFLSPFFRLNSSFMCAGGIKNEDACFGDGGSPLVCPIPNNEGRYYQVGIVSWGLDGRCGEENVPGVYADIKSLRPWVDLKVAGMGLGSSTYTPAG